MGLFWEKAKPGEGGCKGAENLNLEGFCKAAFLPFPGLLLELC